MIGLKHPLSALLVGPALYQRHGRSVAAGPGADLWRVMSGGTRSKASVEVAVDASAAWKTQLDRWQETVQVDGVVGFRSLLSQINHDVSRKLGGWPLLSLECVPYPAGWKCSAVYKRGVAGEAAGTNTNESLLAAITARLDRAVD